ncbi:hypothetical protein ACYG9R_02975 [Mesorhizobium sp. RSR565B]|uniref:hypothetical protein n=1 Tax=unclassified Mesorhizobium TaxID=325217 RepID=UPI0003CFFEE6|nr:hypothetical protein [Mesorhizobium sp. L103C565B0]ESZ47999.1 hypothetical protein X730_15390 [Mesorhizobium sp. L103C565B0]
MPIRKIDLLIGFVAGAVVVGSSAALWKMLDDAQRVGDVCSKESTMWWRLTGQSGAKALEEMSLRAESCIAGQGTEAWSEPVEYLFCTRVVGSGEVPVLKCRDSQSDLRS